MRTTSSILCVIASFIAAGKNQISITELVILSGISRQSVKWAIQTLEQAGQITVTRTTTNGRHEANAYYLPDQDSRGSCSCRCFNATVFDSCHFHAR
ncbi:transcriptional regulator (plasmid) [Escherichia coli]|nr:transcriptional regulator [Escherichia coli]